MVFSINYLRKSGSPALARGGPLTPQNAMIGGSLRSSNPIAATSLKSEINGKNYKQSSTLSIYLLVLR